MVLVGHKIAVIKTIQLCGDHEDSHPLLNCEDMLTPLLHQEQY